MLESTLSFCARRLGVSLALGGVLAMSECAGQWAYQPAERGFGVDLGGAMRYGPVDGYVQTPNGGAPGTTSNKRPTFNELGIDSFISPEASLDLHWRAHGLYADGDWVRLDGNSTLNSTLTSHGTTFPAGTSVRSRVQLDSYRVGYEYRLAWTNDGGSLLSFSPAAGIDLLNFDYRLHGEGGLAANRGYFVGSPQLGFGAEWLPPGRFSISGGLFSSLPEVSNLFALSAQVTGGYRLWGQGERGGRLFLGIGYDWLDYKDNQQVPNHVKADLGPMLLFGLHTRF